MLVANFFRHLIGFLTLSCIFRVFEETNNKYYEQSSEFLNSTNTEGKLPIELACVLGRTKILQDLIKRGVDITATNSSGDFFYRALCSD